MKINRALTLALTLPFIFLWEPLTAQNCKAEIEVLDHRTLRGTVSYYFPASSDSATFLLQANGYAGKNTQLADSLFQHFNPCLYFASGDKLGGYTELEWSSESGKLAGSYDGTREAFTTSVPVSKTIHVGFVLSLPARCAEMGFDPDYMILSRWLPKPKDTHEWTYLVMIQTSPMHQILSGDFIEEKIEGDIKRTTLISSGNSPDLAITQKKLSSSREKDKNGRSYTLYWPAGKRAMSNSKKYRYMYSVSLNQKDSLAKSRIVVDDDRYAKLHNLLFFSRGSIQSRTKSFYPSYRYTDKGNHMVGFSLSNAHRGKQAVYYFINPLFSFTNDFNWYVGLMKPMRLKKGSISQITPILTYKKFHYFTKKEDDYTLDYHRISPRLKVMLKNHKWINLEYAFIREQTALYEGNRINFGHLNSSLIRVSYDQTKKTTLYSWALHSHLERFAYENLFGENHDFIKLSASLSQVWRTSMTRNFRARIFFAKFLTNDQRASTNYSDFITKGSIALVPQGWHDYAYDDVFIARRNQDGLLTNQVGNMGGGFKNAPSNTTSLGLSNDFAASINLSYDLFTIRKTFRFFAFGDGGIYRQYNNNRWKMKNLYSAGLGLAVSCKVSIYLPILNHADINSNYRNEDLSFFERWSFSIQFQEKFNSNK